MSSATSRRRKVLSLAERVRVIDRAEKGDSARSIAKALGVGKTQIQGILAKKDSVLDLWKSGKNGNIQYLTSKSKNGDLNQLVWDWFTKARSRNMVVTGPLLQEKAKELAKEMGFENFSASNGWLDAFKKRYGAKSLSQAKLVTSLTVLNSRNAPIYSRVAWMVGLCYHKHID